MKMKPVPKSVIKVAVISLLVVALILLSLYFFYLQKPKDYLSEKYNVPKSEFAAVFMSPKKHEKYKAKWLELNGYDYWVPTQWTYKRGNRFFHIEYYNGYYVDDYQLDDLWKWSVEFLQKNVDEHIDGIQLNETDIYMSTKIFNGLNSELENYNKLWTKDDIGMFLAQKKGINAYYKVDDLSQYATKIPAGYKTNNEYFYLFDELSEKATAVLKKDFSVRPTLHTENYNYRRINMYRKYGISSFSSTYGIDIQKDIKTDIY